MAAVLSVSLTDRHRSNSPHPRVPINTRAAGCRRRIMFLSSYMGVKLSAFGAGERIKARQIISDVERLVICTRLPSQSHQSHCWLMFLHQALWKALTQMWQGDAQWGHDFSSGLPPCWPGPWCEMVQMMTSSEQAEGLKDLCLRIYLQEAWLLHHCLPGVCSWFRMLLLESSLRPEETTSVQLSDHYAGFRIENTL